MGYNLDLQVRRYVYDASMGWIKQITYEFRDYLNAIENKVA